MNGGRPYTAWWLRYPGRGERAAELLARWAPAVERRISYWESAYPGEVDWAPVLWDAAYRAAWRCDSEKFWPLLKHSMEWAASKHVATHKRRLTKLNRIELAAWNLDRAASGLEWK